MNLAAIVSFYDEHPDDLTRMVRSLNGLVDQVITLDGAYQLFPDGKACSPPDQYQALETACEHIDVPLHAHIPRTTWAGNEVHKRAALFDHAREHHAGWVLRIDADEHITHTYPAQARDRLAQTTLDVATVTVTGISPSGPDRQQGRDYTGPHRMIFRMLPALTCLDVHWRYADLNTGRDLWGPQSDNTPALDLTHHITITHSERTNAERTQRAWAYYQQRATHRIEGIV
jgi:hypothetical protein